MPAAGRVPRTSAPAGAIASSRRSTAATGAAAPSSAHDHPPKAIALVVMAAVAKVTARSSGRVPPAAAAASDQNTARLAATTSKRLQATGRSRSRVARHWSSKSCCRRARKRSTTQLASPKSRNSLAECGSTARR